MINFENCVWGFLFFVFGILIMIHTVKTKKEIGKDTYGGIIKMGAAAIGSILAGLYLFLTELSKLW